MNESKTSWIAMLFVYISEIKVHILQLINIMLNEQRIKTKYTINGKVIFQLQNDV